MEHEGIGAGELERRIRAGELERIRRGVIGRAGGETDGGVPEVAHLRLIEATMLLLVENFVLSHQSAGVVHGLPLPAAELGRVHITRAVASGKRTRTLAVHRDELPAGDVMRSPQGWPVTTGERTALDLARTLSRPAAVAVVDHALRIGVRRDALLGRLEGARYLRGATAARAVIRFADARSESPGESQSRVLMDRLGLPAPDLQVVVAEAGARSDFGWPDYMLLGEFDGDGKYGNLRPGDTPLAAFKREKERDRRLRQTGWDVLHWGWSDLRDPAAFERMVRSRLRR